MFGNEIPIFGYRFSQIDPPLDLRLGLDDRGLQVVLQTVVLQELLLAFEDDVFVPASYEDVLLVEALAVGEPSHFRQVGHAAGSVASAAKQSQTSSKNDSNSYFLLISKLRQ